MYTCTKFSPDPYQTTFTNKKKYSLAQTSPSTQLKGFPLIVTQKMLKTYLKILFPIPHHAFYFLAQIFEMEHIWIFNSFKNSAYI